VKTKRNQSTT